MKKDSSIVVGQNDSRIPTIAESEEIIREKAPAALKALAQLGGLDLIETLGLSPYTESEN